jgi:hypothetical protein
MRSYRRTLLVIAAAVAAGLTVLAPPAGAASAVWTQRATADPGLGGGYALTDVVCSATTDCTSVGYAWASPSFERGAAVPLAEHWNGAGWSVESTPVPAGAVDSQLNAVWCEGFTGHPCLAVGYTSQGFQNSTPRQALAMSWDGNAWTLLPAPVPAGSLSVELQGISCTQPAACKAVGDYSRTAQFDTHPFIATWNGTAWSIDAFNLPSTAVSGTLQDVSCGDADSCSAVGYWANSAGKTSALAETWNGSTWHLDGTANPGGTTGLLGAGCASHTTCTAVGSHSTITGNYVGLAERRVGGSWSAQNPPNVPGASSSALEDVDCRSASFCVAAGAANGRDVNPTGYAEVWNGLYWKIEYQQVSGNALSGVSCWGLTFCMAVGNSVLGARVGQSFTRTS